MALQRVCSLLVCRLFHVIFLMAIALLVADLSGFAQEAVEPPPAATVPLRPPLLLQERLLSPVPQQFDWMRRESLANPLLESLVDPQRTQSRLLLSMTLSSEYSDNFRRTDNSAEVDEAQGNIRTALTFGSVYRRERTRSFLSLANTISASHDTIDQNVVIGFANLGMSTGYTWPRLSVALSDNFVVDDDRSQVTQGIESDRNRFLSNSFSPQMRYTLSPLSALTLRYHNTVVVNLEESEFDSVSHSITPRFEYRFSRVVEGSVSYTLRTVDQRLDDDDELSHNIVANLGWMLSARTQFRFNLDTLYIDQRPNTIEASIQMNAGFSRQLSPRWRFFIAAGPSYVSRSNLIGGVKEDDKVILANWEVSLDGQVATRTHIALTSSQVVENTSGEIANRGLVLRTKANLQLSQTFTPDLRSALSIGFGRNDFLQNRDPDDPSQSREDLFVTAGLTGTYAFTSTLSLALTYEYEQRFSDSDAFDFQENRVTLALSSSF